MKGLFLIEHEKASGTSIWARILGKYLENKNVVKIVESYKTLEFFKAFFILYKHDFIHFYSQTFQAGLLSFLAHLLRKKIIYTVHGNIKAEVNSKRGTFIHNFKKLLWIPIHQYIFAVSDGITFPSSFNKKSNSSFIKNNNRVATISNPLIIDDLAPQHPYSKGNLELAIITNFKYREKERGIDFLALVLTELKKNSYSSVLHIIGDGENLENYRERYKNRNDIIFYGHLVPAKRNEVLRKCHIFTYASFLDNMPYAILDAINLRLPVITNDIGAVKDILPPEYIVPNEDVKEYARRLQNLLKEKDFKEAQEKQFRLLKEKFSVEQVGQKFIEFYQRVIDS